MSAQTPSNPTPVEPQTQEPVVVVVHENRFTKQMALKAAGIATAIAGVFGAGYLVARAQDPDDDGLSVQFGEDTDEPSED